MRERIFPMLKDWCWCQVAQNFAIVKIIQTGSSFRALLSYALPMAAGSMPSG